MDTGHWTAKFAARLVKHRALPEFGHVQDNKFIIKPDQWSGTITLLAKVFPKPWTQ
jgi:hypothetical protein